VEILPRTISVQLIGAFVLIAEFVKRIKRVSFLS